MKVRLTLPVPLTSRRFQSSWRFIRFRISFELLVEQPNKEREQNRDAHDFLRFSESSQKLGVSKCLFMAVIIQYSAKTTNLPINWATRSTTQAKAPNTD